MAGEKYSKGKRNKTVLMLNAVVSFCFRPNWTEGRVVTLKPLTNRDSTELNVGWMWGAGHSIAVLNGAGA
jgi:hypothetical protein